MLNHVTLNFKLVRTISAILFCQLEKLTADQKRQIKCLESSNKVSLRAKFDELSLRGESKILPQL